MSLDIILYVLLSLPHRIFRQNVVSVC